MVFGVLSPGFGAFSVAFGLPSAMIPGYGKTIRYAPELIYNAPKRILKASEHTSKASEPISNTLKTNRNRGKPILLAPK